MAGFLVALAAAAVMAQEQQPAAPAEAPQPAPVAAAPAAAPATAAKPARAQSDKICVEEPATGSLFRRRICATREEWARRQRQDQQTMTEDAPSASK